MDKYEEALEKMCDAAQSACDHLDGEYVPPKAIRAAAEAIGLREMMERLERLQDEVDLINSERS